MKEKEYNHIQKYGRNMDGSISAFKKKDEDNEKVKKRLEDFFKKKKETWKQCKRRVDAEKAETPQKCLSLLDKT